MAITWENFYDAVSAKVGSKIKASEIFESDLNVNSVMTEVMKELLVTGSVFKRKTVERDTYKDVAGKQVLYRDDTVIEITGPIK